MPSPKPPDYVALSMIRSIRAVFLTAIFISAYAVGLTQTDATVRGKIKDRYNKPVDSIEVVVDGEAIRIITDSTGSFQFKTPPGKKRIGFRDIRPIVKYHIAVRELTLGPAARKFLSVVLSEFELVVEIGEDKDPTAIPDRPNFQILPIEPKEVRRMPSPKLDIESKLEMIGAVKNNEFSSQYRVRGGNFDENLIYVNDIEIYRPFLIRNGQQEGLGFVNPNLANRVAFSTGGFESRFGDKMSSVLDVDYKTPHRFHGTAELGLISANVHVEGSSKNKADPDRPGRFTYLIGARRFAISYILNSLDVQGNYQPNFHDVQGMFGYTFPTKSKEPKIREKSNGELDTIYFPKNRLKLHFLFNVANNKYRFIPETRETSFGTVQTVLRLRVAFEGRERTEYLTGLGALMLEHKPSSRLRFKYIFTGFRTKESEVFDVEGGYWLSDVNTNFGNEGFNEVVFDRGIGTNYRHARNYLNAQVWAAEQRAEWFPGGNYRHHVSWGVRAQNQIVNDEITEWNGVDSAGYFSLEEHIRSQLNIDSWQFKAYLQDDWSINKKGTNRLIVGTRAVYNTLNSQFYLSPRAQFIIDPSSAEAPADLNSEEYRKWEKRKYQIRFAAGLYHQPPFYREMRAHDGTLNTSLPAQTSAHFIAGGDYRFEAWGRPFKFFGELYYKRLYNLIPFEIDNVRIRYYPNNPGVGYAYGTDLRVNGEFIRGVDSWMSLGLLNTKEDVTGDGQGFVNRPTNQIFTFAMYFQDELPINPTYKVHVNFVYGSGLRIGPPGNIVNRTAFTAPAYNRVDLGFSKLISLKSIEEYNDAGLALHSLWITAEIFNLFQRSNTVSYTWIKDVFNTQFAVPNFLSARLLNIRIIGTF